MKIGEVADAAGVSVDTVRYYERRGIIPPPPRRPSGYRIYDPATIERIVRARRLRQLGLTLDEIVEAFGVHDAGEATCEGERWRLDVVLDRIDAQLAELNDLRRVVQRTRDRCRSGTCELVDCPTSG